MRFQTLGVLSEAAILVRDRYLELARWHPGVLGLSGYGSQREVRVVCRVQMTRQSAQRSWLVQKRGFRQFVDTPVPRYPILIQVGKAVRIAESDRGGFVDLTLKRHGLSPGWHTLRIHPIHRGDYLRHKSELFKDVGWGKITPAVLARRAQNLGVRLGQETSLRIRVIGDQEKVGIVSDVDDTLMVSMVPRPLMAARYAILSKVSSRQAVPGMAEFLQELRRQAAGPDLVKRAPAQFYLSTGAWNIVPTLRPFLRRMGFPRGTVLLRSWWFTDKGLPGKGSDFKLSEFQRLVDMFPQVKWILVGDNGQQDPQTFTTFANRWPHSLAAIVIRQLDVTEHLLSHGRTEQTVRGDKGKIPRDVPLVYGRDGYELQRAIQSKPFKEALQKRLHS